MAKGVPLPKFLPVGLDGGLVGILIIDIALTWIGHPRPGLRAAARLFAAGTLIANAAAGWPDPLSILLRVFAPALIIVITEAVRAVLLGREREGRDPIPFARWILAPWPTFRLWRRMVLWQITSYSAAVSMELSRRQAIVQLTAYYDGDWRKFAPADVVWMLRNGVRMDAALAAVAALTVPSPEPSVSAHGTAQAVSSVSAQRARKGKRPSAHAGDLSTELRALNLLTAEPALREPRMGAELARRLGVSDATGRRLHARLRNSTGSAAPVSAEG
jgi:hypothetical protein